MSESAKKPAKRQCELTTSPQRRAAAERTTDRIAAAFPAGLARPALRALAAAGYERLEQLHNASETELAALHGMGPKALRTLKTALAQKQFALRP